MIQTILGFLSNIWVRRALLAIVAVIAFLALRQHYVNLGHKQGIADQTQTDADQREKERSADRAETEGKLKLLQQQINDAATHATQQQQLFVSLLGQRQQAATQVAGMTEAQVEAIVAKYSPRQLADCVTQLPFCNQQLEAKVQESVEKDKQIAGEQQKYGDLADYTVSLERTYADLYNSKAIARRSWKCLKIWHCSRPKITAPDPSTLKRPSASR